MSPTMAEAAPGFCRENEITSVGVRFPRYLRLSDAMAVLPTNAMEISADSARSLSSVATAARRIAVSDAGKRFSDDDTATQ